MKIIFKYEFHSCMLNWVQCVFLWQPHCDLRVVRTTAYLKAIMEVYGKEVQVWALRTSDGGNGNHSASLSIILIKIEVDQMLPSSYISSQFCYFAFGFLFP